MAIIEVVVISNIIVIIIHGSWTLKLSEKNTKNDYFDQRLGCAAPKRWSKYTTRIHDR